LFADGTFETYDDIQVVRNDAGRMVFERVEGKWTQRGSVDSATLAALREAVSDHTADALTGKWRTTGPRSARTHLTTRRGEEAIELCYLGTEVPKPLKPLQDRIHDLVNHVDEGLGRGTGGGEKE